MKYPTTLLSRLFVAYLCLTCWIIVPINASATSASISVSGNEGAITVSASASFSTHTFCSGSGDNKKCWDDNSGTLSIYKNTYWPTLASIYGKGSASWSDVFNGGTLSQGEHTFIATATDSKGITQTSKKTITIDNTPSLTMTVGDTEGDMDVKGTVDFKENIEGSEGSIFIKFTDNVSYSAVKYYEGSAPINWTWEEIKEHKLNTGTLVQGTHKFTVTATAANGAQTSQDYEFTIDNTPLLTLSVADTEGDMDVKGTVDFKENISGNEGSVFIRFTDNVSYYAVKYYEGSAPINWTWEEIKGHKLNAGTIAQGTHKFTVTATAANGAQTSQDYEFTIDNTPLLTLSVADTEGDMDVKGTVDFKENISGNEGSVFIKFTDNVSYYAVKYYEGSAPINWTWEEIKGYKLNAGTIAQGDHKFTVTATAANGAQTSKYHEFTIDNTPSPIILGPKYFPDDTFDILGTTTFNENITGNEGTVTLYTKEISAKYYSRRGSISYEGKKISWRYSDFTGARMQQSVWGQREILVKAVATAVNGASATVVKGMVIPALGCPTTFGN